MPLFLTCRPSRRRNLLGLFVYLLSEYVLLLVVVLRSVKPAGWLSPWLTDGPSFTKRPSVVQGNGHTKAHATRVSSRAAHMCAATFHDRVIDEDAHHVGGHQVPPSSPEVSQRVALRISGRAGSTPQIVKSHSNALAFPRFLMAACTVA